MVSTSPLDQWASNYLKTTALNAPNKSPLAKVIFFSGKGGVGRSTLATKMAQHLAQQGKRTLLVHVLTHEQLRGEPQAIEKKRPNLWAIRLRSQECFEEYIALKLKLKALYSVFLGSRFTRYIERAAPGVREMVLLGKLWYERSFYDHVVVDLPSTGYSVTMFRTMFNFRQLFPGGPIAKDAAEMIESFSNPREAKFFIVSLPEEMPVQESLELGDIMASLFPLNTCELVFNRCLPKLSDGTWREQYPKLHQYFFHRHAAQQRVLEDYLKRLTANLQISPLHIDELEAGVSVL